MPDKPDSPDGPPAVMQIGEVAARTELSLRSLRHWEEVGLLRPSGRTDGGFRLYTEVDVEKILVIRRMKPLGFTLEEMGEAMRDIETLRDRAGTNRDSGARARLNAILAEAGERRRKLAGQLAMADEFIDQLGRELGPSIDLGALRYWWAGPLDVGGLAAESVGSVVDAIGKVSTARGLGAPVSTSAQLIAASFAAVENLRVDGRQGQGWAPYSGFFASQDGWVRLHGNYPHHAAVIESVLGVDSPETLKLAIAALPAHEVAQRITEAHGIATAVRTEAEWMAHPHAIATANEPWHTTTPGADRPPLAPGELPLTGVRVLDLTRVIAGPTCSQLLACLGADVLRIDPPHRPELLDQYLSNGMGKRSVAADLNQEADRIRRELLPTADVVLLGYRPGALTRFGLDADTLTTDHPHLIIGSLSAWGESGPWAHRPGFDSIVQATSGIADVYRNESGRPGALPVQALDHSTGLVLAAGVINLLAAAQGGVVRTTLLGAARELLRRPRSFTTVEAAFEVPHATVGSPHGSVLTVPPPVLLAGHPITRDIGRYGGSKLAWL